MSEYPAVPSQAVPWSARLKDRIAIVMGAGSSGPGWGNGKATALTFARAGATVVCVDHKPEAAAETTQIITSEGGRASAVTADVTVEDDVARTINDVLAEHDRIDILHNNVGIGWGGAIADVNRSEWEQIFAANTVSAMLAMKHALPHMASAGRGVVTNVSSIAGSQWAGVPAVAYGTSKAALNHLTRLVAAEYAPTGVRVNLIIPGLMRTPMVEDPAVLSAFSSTDIEHMFRKRASMTPVDRMGDAWDIAAAALFLASDDASYITGTSLAVDGGMSVGKPYMGDD